MANRHNGANGGHRYTRAGLTHKQLNMLREINAGWVIEKGMPCANLATAKSLFARGLVQLEITDTNWICKKVDA
jgi:hypothetical protein